MSDNFLSPALSAISAETDSLISSHLNQLDQISNDIRLIESKLKKAAIPFSFLYTLFSKRKFIVSEDRNTRSGYIIETNYSGKYYLNNDLHVPINLFEYVDHCIVWAQTKDGTRLFYNEYLTKKEFSFHEGEELRRTKVHTRLLSSKPLIETKAHCRMSLTRDLPIFYRCLVEKLQSEKKDSCYLERSPFYHDSTPEQITSPIIEDNYFLLGIYPPLEIKEVPFVGAPLVEFNPELDEIPF